MRDNRGYIRILLYSYYTTITGWRVLLTLNPKPPQLRDVGLFGGTPLVRRPSESRQQAEALAEISEELYEPLKEVYVGIYRGLGFRV